MMRMIFSIYIKKVWPQTEPLSMLLVSKASHGLAVNVLLEMPRPVDRQRVAIPYTEPQCGVNFEGSGVRAYNLREEAYNLESIPKRIDSHPAVTGARRARDEYYSNFRIRLDFHVTS